MVSNCIHLSTTSSSFLPHSLSISLVLLFDGSMSIDPLCVYACRKTVFFYKG